MEKIKKQLGRTAFTLAEILITLGIIGVVAALTMPALIQNYKNHVVETRLKKFYSIMNQAVLMAKNDYGDFENWDYWTHDKKDEDGNFINQQDTMKHSIEKYFAPYMKIVNIKKLDMGGEFAGEYIYMYFLADGSAFTQTRHENREFNFFPKNPEKCYQKGLNGGTTAGECAFIFGFKSDDRIGGWKYHYKKAIEPFMCEWNGDIDKLNTHPIRGCATSGHFCTALIARNGWKIPKNYPRKIKI